MENKFCPQIPPGRCLPVIFVPSILAFNLLVPWAAQRRRRPADARSPSGMREGFAGKVHVSHLLLVSNNRAREKAK